ncbi:hypothetical protein PIB30_025716 [Stylosanthes scabra]|uniref:Uncharacterized protein n=1 Tax=Stylosanthes scabra TaxID=79078 RepID=A0ABU6ZAM0_9FABA|nr:hypothetical protein [Stylosanthes scabra]
MGSGVIYYEYEKCEKFEDYDLKADAELGTFKIRRYHFDNESFVHPLHSIRFDLDRPYKIPIEALMANQPLSSSDNTKTSAQGSHHSRHSSPTPHYSPSIDLVRRRDRLRVGNSFRHLKVGCAMETKKKRRLEGCNPVSRRKKLVRRMKRRRIRKKIPRKTKKKRTPRGRFYFYLFAYGCGPDEDYLQYLEVEDYLQYLEVRQHSPEYSPFHSGQALVPDLPEDSVDRRSVSYGAPSYDLSGVWPSPS